MSRIKRARPSPALVISIIAMFAALGGGAFAATATTSKQALNNKGNLNKNVVKKKNIAKNAVVTNKIKKGKVTGSKLSEGAVSAEKLGSITEESNTQTIPVGTTGTVEVSCGEKKVIGGGWKDNQAPTGANGAIPYVDQRTDNGWRASALAVGTARQITVYAYCLNGNG